MATATATAVAGEVGVKPVQRVSKESVSGRGKRGYGKYVLGGAYGVGRC